MTVPRCYRGVTPAGTRIFELVSPVEAGDLIRANRGNASFTILDVREGYRYDASHIIGAMNSVMQGARGTARAVGSDAPYQMAGKSGTAQVFSVAQDEEYDEEEIEERLKDHALFIAFAPVENPQIAVAVIVENGSSGSGVAAPIARAIMDKYLGYDDAAD